MSAKNAECFGNQSARANETFEYRKGSGKLIAVGFSKKRWPEVEDPSGIFLKVNPETRHIESISIICESDKQEAVVRGALARIAKPSCWQWLKRLVGFCAD